MPSKRPNRRSSQAIVSLPSCFLLTLRFSSSRAVLRSIILSNCSPVSELLSTTYMRSSAKDRGKAKGRSLGAMGAPTLRENPVHRAHRESGRVVVQRCCARPTGGRHGRTTNAPAQRFNGTNLSETLEVGYEKRGHARSGVTKAWPRAV